MSSRGFHYSRPRFAGRQAVHAALPQTSHGRLTREEDLKRLFLPSGLSHLIGRVWSYLIDRVWSCKLLSLRIFPRRPQVRSQDFSFLFLKKHVFRGEDFCYFIMFNKIFLGYKRFRGYKRIGGALTPWLRVWAAFLLALKDQFGRMALNFLQQSPAFHKMFSVSQGWCPPFHSTKQSPLPATFKNISTEFSCKTRAVVLEKNGASRQSFSKITQATIQNAVQSDVEYINITTSHKAIKYFINDLFCLANCLQNAEICNKQLFFGCKKFRGHT